MHKARNMRVFDVNDLDLPDFSSGSVKSQEELRLKNIQVEIAELKAVIAEKDGEISALHKIIEETRVSSEKSGYNSGYDTAKEDLSESFELQFNERIQKYAEKIDSVINDLVSAKNNVISRSEESVVELVFKLVEKIVFHEVRYNRDCIVDVVKNALPAVDSAVELEIVAHPDDVQVLKEFDNLWLPLTMKRDCVTYIEKESITPGGLVISTNLGKVDIQIENAIDNLKDALLSHKKSVKISE